MHNESLNAWTMVISLVAGMLLCFQNLQSSKPLFMDSLPFYAMLIGQALHTPVSVGYHLFMPISPETANYWRRMDLSLVFVMNLCAAYSLAYFTFGEHDCLLGERATSAVS